MDTRSIGLCPQGFESPRCRLCSFKRFLFHRPCSRSPCFLFFPLCHISHPLPVSLSLHFSIYPSFSLSTLCFSTSSLFLFHISPLSHSLCVLLYAGACKPCVPHRNCSCGLMDKALPPKEEIAGSSPASSKLCESLIMYAFTRCL